MELGQVLRVIGVFPARPFDYTFHPLNPLFGRFQMRAF